MNRLNGPCRVVFLLQELNFGGSQTQALELARGLDPARFQVELWTLMAGLDLLPVARQWGIPVRQLGKAGYVWPPALARLAAALRSQRPHLLLLYTAIPNIWGRLLGRLNQVPAIVATCRGSLEPARQLDRWLWRWADHHICNAQALKDLLIRSAGVDHKVISVIPNGVDIERFQPAPPLAGTPAQVVLALGRLAPEKGHEVLLRAFELIAPDHPQAQLWLAGEGPLKPRLIRQARAGSCPERIRFLPATSEAPALLRRASILALPSRHEGLPNVVLEAMASGLPVVASRVGGVAELVQSGLSGLMPPLGDVPAWASALAFLLESPELARSWGEAGRRRVMTQFSLEAMVQAHQELFSRLLAQGRD